MQKAFEGDRVLRSKRGTPLVIHRLFLEVEESFFSERRGVGELCSNEQLILVSGEFTCQSRFVSSEL